MAPITVEHVIEVLNRALKEDPKATRELFTKRVYCNNILAQDPTIQVNKISDTRYDVGILDLINGIFGVQENGCGYIAAIHKVVCPATGKEANGKVEDVCPDCGEKLHLGELVRFEYYDTKFPCGRQHKSSSRQFGKKENKR